jgi:hypothetical protein
MTRRRSSQRSRRVAFRSRLVSNTRSGRGPGQWSLAAVEHPWRHPDGKDEFIDLLAYCGTVVLVIECKKAQERALVFLRPVGANSTGMVTSATVLQAEQNTGAGRRWGTSLVHLEELRPESYRAQFCVSDQRLLEAEARLVVLAADAVAGQLDGLQLPSRSFLVLRRLLVGRLVFRLRTGDGRPYYEFSGEGSLSGILAGIVATEGLVAPTGSDAFCITQVRGIVRVA